MQIHELGTRTTQATDWLALDTNSQTYKAKTGQLRPEFTSHDTSNPASWDDMAVISSSINITTFFERLSYAVKNLRYIWKLIGSGDFSNVAETLSGAIGNTALTTTATTISGAIAEHEEDISTINGNLTPTSEETLVNGITYQKQAGIVFVRFNIAATIGTSFTTIGTLPTGYRPHYNVYFRIAGGDGVGDVTVIITTLGNIQAKVDTGSATALNGLVSFITYG